MIGAIFKALVGTNNERELKKLEPMVQLINSFEPQMKSLSDAEIRGKTDEFRARIAEVISKSFPDPAEADPMKVFHAEQEVLDTILPEAFAAVREASVRSTGMRHFDVQMVGGIILHKGRIAEMKTGEGKTLVAPLAAYLNALSGRGVHIVTVNDYLARRDAEWMGRIFRFLGLTVGTVVHGLDDAERKAAYG